MNTPESQQLAVALFQFVGPLCDPIGFQNHRGECWNDAVQEVLLFADGLKEITQPVIYQSSLSALAERVAAEGVSPVYLEYLRLLRARFITHYNYVRATDEIRGVVSEQKRRMSLACSVGAATTMLQLFKGAEQGEERERENFIGRGLAADLRNEVFTTVCRILGVPFVAVKLRGWDGMLPSYTAFFLSSIAYSGGVSIGGHTVAALRCGGIWYWFDDNEGVQEIAQSQLATCFAEPEFGFFYVRGKVQFIKVRRAETGTRDAETPVTQFVERGGLALTITDMLEEAAWMPMKDTIPVEVDRVYGIKSAEGITVIRPRRTVAEIMAERKRTTGGYRGLVIRKEMARGSTMRVAKSRKRGTAKRHKTRSRSSGV